MSVLETELDELLASVKKLTNVLNGIKDEREDEFVEDDSDEFDEEATTIEELADDVECVITIRRC